MQPWTNHSNPTRLRPVHPRTVPLCVLIACLAATTAAAGQVREINSDFDQWVGAAPDYHVAAFEQHFEHEPDAPPTGCVSDIGMVTMTVAGGTVALEVSNGDCPVVDGSTGLGDIADARVPFDASLSMTFDPPIKAFFTYFASVELQESVSMRLLSSDGTVDETLVSPPSTDHVLAAGNGFLSAVPISRLEFTSSDVNISILGYFGGLLLGENGFEGGCDGVACDFGYAYETVQRTVFGTPTAGTGDLGSWPEAGEAEGIEAGDAICQYWATEAGLDRPNNFIALLSDSNSDLACRMRGLDGSLANNCDVGELPLVGPWWHVNGTPWAGPLDGGVDQLSLRRPPMLDVFGARYQDLHHTGTRFDGTVIPETCGDWTVGDDSLESFRGLSTDTQSWLARGFRDCNQPAPLMCLEVGAAPPLPSEPTFGRVAFVTRASGPGNIAAWPEVETPVEGPIEAADLICQDEAAAAGLEDPESFRAWLSTRALDAISRLTNDGTWRRADNVRLAGSRSGLTSGVLETSLSVGANGLPRSAPVWTGTSSPGLATSFTCDGWTSSASTAWGTGGVTSNVESWTDRAPNNGERCDQNRPLYCFSDASDPAFVFADGFEFGTTSAWSSSR